MNEFQKYWLNDIQLISDWDLALAWEMRICSLDFV